MNGRWMGEHKHNNMYHVCGVERKLAATGPKTVAGAANAERTSLIRWLVAFSLINLSVLSIDSSLSVSLSLFLLFKQHTQQWSGWEEQ